MRKILAELKDILAIIQPCLRLKKAKGEWDKAMKIILNDVIHGKDKTLSEAEAKLMPDFNAEGFLVNKLRGKIPESDMNDAVSDIMEHMLYGVPMKHKDIKRDKEFKPIFVDQFRKNYKHSLNMIRSIVNETQDPEKITANDLFKILNKLDKEKSFLDSKIVSEIFESRDISVNNIAKYDNDTSKKLIDYMKDEKMNSMSLLQFMNYIKETKAPINKDVNDIINNEFKAKALLKKSLPEMYEKIGKMLFNFSKNVMNLAVKDYVRMLQEEKGISRGLYEELQRLEKLFDKKEFITEEDVSDRYSLVNKFIKEKKKVNKEDFKSFRESLKITKEPLYDVPENEMQQTIEEGDLERSIIKEIKKEFPKEKAQENVITVLQGLKDGETAQETADALNMSEVQVRRFRKTIKEIVKDLMKTETKKSYKIAAYLNELLKRF